MGPRRVADVREHRRLERPFALIVERYRAGASTTIIALSFSVSAQGIRSRLIEADVERRPPVAPPVRISRAEKPPPGAEPRRGDNRRTVEEFSTRTWARGMTQRQVAYACRVRRREVSEIARLARLATDLHRAAAVPAAPLHRPRVDVDTRTTISETPPRRPVALNIPPAGRRSALLHPRHRGRTLMSKSYRIRLDGGAMVTFGSPEAIKESLEVHWPAGRYDIHEGHATGSSHARLGRRWGTAIKAADGAVTLAAEPDAGR